MMSEKKALQIFIECIDEMYKNSSPPISWDTIQKKYGKTKIPFYENHSITEKKYDEIKNKYYKKLDTFYRRKLDWFLLDYAPKFKQKKEK